VAELDAGDLGLRLGGFADWLAGAGRSPLYVALLRGAVKDLEAGGVVARAFEGIAAPPGSVPALRLMAALHYLVLRGEAPELARFYPSAGGVDPPKDAWPAAAALLERRLEQVRLRLRRGVQTNEPGRSAAIYGALLSVSERLAAPLQLLEIGASAGLNLLADRFAYRAGNDVLGDASSPLCFHEPWRGTPVGDLAGAASRLRLAARSGCDPAPIDIRRPGARELLLSYLWPDEPERLARLEAALSVARADPPRVHRSAASIWLPRVLAERSDAVPLIVQTVMWQYLAQRERAAITACIERAGSRRTLVWLTMEPGENALARFELSVRTWPGGERLLLARCRDHGPPVEWLAS
jgi:hypothetical protein